MVSSEEGFRKIHSKFAQASRVATTLLQRKEVLMGELSEAGNVHEILAVTNSLNHNLQRELKLYKIAEKGLSKAEDFLLDERARVRKEGNSLERFIRFFIAKVPILGRRIARSEMYFLLEILINSLLKELNYIEGKIKKVEIEINGQLSITDFIISQAQDSPDENFTAEIATLLNSLRKQLKINEKVHVKESRRLAAFEKYIDDFQKFGAKAIKNQKILAILQGIVIFPGISAGVAAGLVAVFGEEFMAEAIIISQLMNLVPMLIAAGIERKSMPSIPKELAL
jgi:hypothetical protein